MAADTSLPEAFICDLSPSARVEIHRQGQPLDLADHPLGTPLLAGDRLILRAGSAAVCMQYSGDRHDLGPLAESAAPIAFDVEKVSLPSPFSRLREAMVALGETLKPKAEEEQVELITKGRGDEPRDRIFPPKHCKATPGDRFAIAWDLDLIGPVLTLSWHINRERIKDVSDEPGSYVFPYDIRTLVAKYGTRIGAGETLAIRWKLEDKQSGKSAEGLMQVQDLPDEDVGAELAPDLEQRQDALLLRVAYLLDRGYCFEARTLMADWEGFGEAAKRSILVRQLGRRVGLFAAR
jgi:hypothetical protein